jgi:hypothetical protein
MPFQQIDKSTLCTARYCGSGRTTQFLACGCGWTASQHHTQNVDHKHIRDLDFVKKSLEIIVFVIFS